MRSILTPHGKQQSVDFLHEMLLAGCAPSLASMLALAPHEPLGPPEGSILINRPGLGWMEGKRARWPLYVLRLSEQFPGYQAGYLYRESMKYGHGFGLPNHAMPVGDAPLSSFVRKRIHHARAKWSGQLEGKLTRLQFVDWLPLHLDKRTHSDGGPLWPDGCDHPHDGWALSYQLLRLACDLPRFALTQRSRT